MQAASQARRVAEINVTPLIDIVLVLLIVFIVMVPMTGRHHPVGVPTNVPGSSVPPGYPVIAIFKDGSCSLRGEPVTLEQLAARLVPEMLLQSRLGRRVQLKVDGAVPMRESFSGRTIPCALVRLPYGLMRGARIMQNPRQS